MRFQKHEGVGLQESLGELTFEGASLSQGQQPCALKRAGGQRAVTWCPCVRKLTGGAALLGDPAGGVSVWEACCSGCHLAEKQELLTGSIFIPYT